MPRSLFPLAQMVPEMCVPWPLTWVFGPDRETADPGPEPASPAPVPEAQIPEVGAVPTISAPELKERLDRGGKLLVVFLGSRPVFEVQHIPGAVAVEPGEVDAFFAARDRDAPVVIYCSCCAAGGAGVSGLYTRRLLDRGFRDVRNLEGHFAAWLECGFPTEP